MRAYTHHPVTGGKAYPGYLPKPGTSIPFPYPNNLKEWAMSNWDMQLYDLHQNEL